MMGHEICYFCHHDFDRHECYPLFGKYYICRECQDLVTGVLQEFVKVNKTTVTVDYNDLSKPDIHEVDKLWDSKRAAK